MTRDITPDLHKIKLYVTEPHQCSYISVKMASTAFVDPKFPLDDSTYSHLSLLGFRRSGRYLYVPRCADCKACIPVRVPGLGFKPSRSQKRCLRRNQDIELDIKREIDSDEHYALYERYINTRHRNGDMYPASPSQYLDFIGKPWDCTHYLEFRLDGRLIGCAVTDWLEDGISAIYTYYDPDERSRGLGTFAILKQIELLGPERLDYVYLGYWIRDSARMAYKSKFRPCELYIENRWLRI